MRELFVTGMRSTGFLARAAELGARSARDDVEWRAAQHEVRARLAQLGTIEQHAQQVDFGVLATAGDAMLKRQRAHCVAVKAFFHALLQIIMRPVVTVVDLDVMAVAVRHCVSV
jgi:hypothetical protein